MLAVKPLHHISAVVVGTGFIGPVHVEALRRLGIRVAGILGSSAEKSRRAAASLGLSRGYASLKELLEDRDVDVVHIASPNRYHREQVLASLDAGKHLVCEKPLAMTSAEAAELVNAAKAHAHLVTAVNYNIRFYPLCLQARAMVRAGEIGDVLHVTGSYLQDWLLLPTDYNWRIDSGEGGALRAVGDIGTHWLDLISFITGLQVECLLADLWTHHSVRRRPVNAGTEAFAGKLQAGEGAVREIPVETEDYGSILLRFSGHARGALTVSQIAAGRKNCIRFEISGTKKSLAWNSEAPQELWIGDRTAPNALLMTDPSLMDEEVRPFANYPGGHQEGFPDTFKQLYRAIYQDVQSGRPSAAPLYATFEDGRREILLCEAILKSHRTNSWVSGLRGA
jgi:predicted dehydrogenase